MAKVYVEQVPQCECGHYLWKLNPYGGPRTASVWICTEPHCPNYGIQLVVPLVQLEVLSLGPATTYKCYGCDAQLYPWESHHHEASK